MSGGEHNAAVGIDGGGSGILHSLAQQGFLLDAVALARGGIDQAHDPAGGQIAAPETTVGNRQLAVHPGGDPLAIRQRFAVVVT